MNFNSVEDILRYAIENEQISHDYYMLLADSIEDERMKEVFTGFAAQELQHKNRIEEALAGNISLDSHGPVEDLKIAESVDPVNLLEKIPDYRDALVIAMQKEKQAYQLYSGLAKIVTEPEMRALLESLAREEALHKLRFETAYDKLD